MTSPTKYPAYPPKRIVGVRIPRGTHRYVIAVTAQEILLERTEGILPIDSLPWVIEHEPSSIIVWQGGGLHIQRLQRVLGDHPRFQYRVTPRHREYRKSNAQVYDALVNFVGFCKDDEAPEGQRPARYHYPLDPVHFVRASIDELRPDINEERIDKLLAWGKEVRTWCNATQLTIKPTSGGLVTQLLRDPRFYPQPRRKVPRLINDAARSQLPGNYYRLHTEPGRSHQAIYLDLTSAHHQMSMGVRFPDANTLHIFGRRDSDKVYAPANLGHLKRPGLFKLRIHTPTLPPNKFPPPWAEHPGVTDQWIYSNEFPILDELGIRVDSVICAMVSRESEEGLNRYARWALEQIRAYPQLKPWLKPTLHSTYGVLAARPMPFETGYHRAAKGTRTEYPMGPVSVPVYAVGSTKPIESKLANVIHRGMIEAEVRKEALWMARYLTEVYHRRVLSIYADSVFITDNGEAPRFLPPWWRIAEHCTNLRFDDATHFVSDELVRLPGFARDKRGKRRADRLARRDAVIRSVHQPTSPGG